MHHVNLQAAQHPGSVDVLVAYWGPVDQSSTALKASGVQDVNVADHPMVAMPV